MAVGEGMKKKKERESPNTLQTFHPHQMLWLFSDYWCITPKQLFYVFPGKFYFTMFRYQQH